MAGFFDGIPLEDVNNAMHRVGDTDRAALGSISLNQSQVDLT